MDQITRDSGPWDLDQLCLQEKNRNLTKGEVLQARGCKLRQDNSVTTNAAQTEYQGLPTSASDSCIINDSLTTNTIKEAICIFLKQSAFQHS